MNGVPKKNKIDPTEARRVVGRVLGENVRQHRSSYTVAVFAMLAVALSTAFVAYIFKDVINKIYYERREDLIIPISLGILAAFVIRGVSDLCTISNDGKSR